MRRLAWYNEIDPFAAAWLRELIREGHIADGVVDERSIADVAPTELSGFAQCHFFAGIGVWSHALRQAGWPDDRPVWTGSCPCQPFSAAGARAGFDDIRHVWPFWHWLISQCRPAVVLGEQVASADGLGWLDLVSADLEGTDYAFGAADLCAAGVGAPHIRQRLWFVGHAQREGFQERQRLAGVPGGAAGGDARQAAERGGLLPTLRLADANASRRADGGPEPEHDFTRSSLPSGRLGHADGAGRETCDGVYVGVEARPEQSSDTGAQRGGLADADIVAAEPRIGDDGRARASEREMPVGHGNDGRPGPSDDFWRASDWLCCRDGKWRPVEPGTFPLAHGAAARVGRLRGYGNALNAEAARTFIEAVM